ncbi:hypothetical protein L226DRAFT_535540 [Lentinus tigrinus ALCF2SS1-7]|uniref:DUF6534 domain-containing protein n=1 Tax=Lentinus tigrinus ALCF2SS1-6 TaxID=1328759 RepID=A0A5C2SFY8_9APHY|nr:hypothetical protein L227DRAFT_600038 [Lentinus tigrinus ALCF2SS1-6]RPD74676.1 hypothetical protein L226DRAFT_535540 [Lentinus tigrinus ALCF2SS1-7]
MAPPYDVLEGLPAIVPNFEDWLPLDKTLGAYLLGTFAGAILYGLSIHQLYRYFRLFPTDSLFIRILVAAVMLLETAHTAMTMHTCYFWLITGFLNFSLLMNESPWSLDALPMILSTIMLTTQLFFAKRVFLLGPKYQLVVGIAMLCLVGEIGFSIALTYRAFTVKGIENLNTAAWLISTALGLGSVADIMFTATLTYVLRRSRSSLKRAAPMELIMLYVVNTGLLHCIFNLISFILTVAITYSLIYGFFSTVTARLYANSLLAVLNSRDPQENKGLEFESGSAYGLNAIARANRRAAAQTWNVPQVNDEPEVIDIKVTTEREEWEKERRKSEKRATFRSTGR